MKVSNSFGSSLTLSKSREPQFLFRRMESNLIHLNEGAVVLGSTYVNPLCTALIMGSFLLLHCLQWSITNLPMALIVLPCVLYILTLLSMILVIVKDPGVVPALFNSKEHSCIPQGKSPPTQILTLKNQVLQQVLYCDHCSIYRSRSTHHCSKCAVCVVDHDHHCHWLGKCVGRNNYSFFVFFIAITLGFFVSIAVESALSLTSAASLWFILVSVNLLISGSLSIYTLQLLLFHLILTYNGATTRNYSKQRILDKQGCNNFTQRLRLRVSNYYNPRCLVFSRQTEEEMSQNNLHEGLSEESSGDKRTNLQEVGDMKELP